jgi:hypothetical protein
MAEKGRLTVEQRVQTVLFAESKSIMATQRGFRARFVTRWAPSPKTIRMLHQQFQQNGSVLERKRGRAASVRTAQNIDAIRVAMQRSPAKSTRRASAELTISRRSVRRILHSDLHLYPYKMSVMQNFLISVNNRDWSFARGLNMEKPYCIICGFRMRHISIWTA